MTNDQFPTSLLDLPCVVESYKTYDDNVLIQTADVGQSVPDTLEYRLGLTPPMRDVRKRRFCREPDLNVRWLQCLVFHLPMENVFLVPQINSVLRPELAQRVERERAEEHSCWRNRKYKKNVSGQNNKAARHVSPWTLNDISWQELYCYHQSSTFHTLSFACSLTSIIQRLCDGEGESVSSILDAVHDQFFWMFRWDL